MQEPKHMEELI